MSSTGTIKKFFEDKGFGFITPDDGSENVFAHVTECPELEECQAGDAVNYDTEWNERKGKYNATNVSMRGSGGYQHIDYDEDYDWYEDYDETYWEEDWTDPTAAELFEEVDPNLPAGGHSKPKETRGRSKYLDSSKRRERTVCRDIMKGYCSKGQECQYYHPDNCRFFKRGECKNGKDCFWVHPDPKQNAPLTLAEELPLNSDGSENA